MGTYYVESFNNVLNIFHHKRISFGDEEYFKRSQLAVCQWNENVGRDYTSTWISPAAAAINPRLNQGKKSYKKCAYNYCHAIWHLFMNQVFE